MLVPDSSERFRLTDVSLDDVAAQFGGESLSIGMEQSLKMVFFDRESWRHETAAKLAAEFVALAPGLARRLSPPGLPGFVAQLAVDTMLQIEQRLRVVKEEVQDDGSDDPDPQD